MNYFSQFFKRNRSQKADAREVRDLHSALRQQVLAIYKESFPEAERDPIENIATSIAPSRDLADITHLRVLMEQEMVVGFAYFSSYREYWLGFLKFITVREDIRGKRYGPILLQDAIQQLRTDGIRAT